MKYYKIWTYVEEVDESEGFESYEDVGEPLSVGDFETYEEADEFREGLHGTRPVIDPSHLREEQS